MTMAAAGDVGAGPAEGRDALAQEVGRDGGVSVNSHDDLTFGEGEADVQPA